MGCQDSKSGAVSDVPPLSEDGKEKVRESWGWYMADDSQANNACLIFVKLFELAPKSKALFHFVDEVSEERLVTNDRLQNHAARVVQAIGTVVDNMDQRDLVEQTVRGLGGRHAGYGVQEEFIQPVAQGVMYSLKRTLKNRFTKDHEKAWLSVLGLVSADMA
ncbi:hypothetical protein ACOMHN_027191 [Nucella lapillus]